jgi:predicted metal-dependent enzyme (double-stranded beta helix superfamily)
MLFGMSTAVRLAADPLTVAARYAAAPDDWPLAPRFDPARRWYHRLSGPDDELEVWLLSWLPGQGTDWHDHGGSGGAFVVVRGELTEHSADGERTQRLHRAGHGRAFGPHHIHQITNNGRMPAVSVHVYLPKLTSMTRYRLVDGDLRADGVDRAGAQW